MTAQRSLIWPGRGRSVIPPLRAIAVALAATWWLISASSAAAQTPAEQARIEQRVESALYRQRELLDHALQAIAPSDPAHINLYFVGVAGDGTQEVFHREVDYVRRQFERDFGAGGRSISLINSRATVDTAPMATRTSLRETLHTVAQKMDRQRDILFLFLTSHGTPEHELVLDQEGIMIPMLPAKTLAALVNEQQFRWKVIVVSACYAGGFIAPLQDDHTLIITAARKDRSSFGCADDNEFTYFGRAFFKEALPRSSSFEQAFERARAIITSWEDADRKAAPKGQGVAYSYPQLFAPAPISAYLRQWWSQAAQH